MAIDPLSKLRFESGGGEGGLFIRFVAGEPVKLRVVSTNPLVANDQFGNTRYNFAVWNHGESKAQILSAGATITRGISELHTDEDYGQDITKLDIKITPTGEKMERRYSIQVLPKTTELTADQADEVQTLDKDLEKYVKNGIRAEEYNDGGVLPDVEAKADEVHPVGDEDEAVDLNDIFPED